MPFHINNKKTIIEVSVSQCNILLDTKFQPHLMIVNKFFCLLKIIT